MTQTKKPNRNLSLALVLGALFLGAILMVPGLQTRASTAPPPETLQLSQTEPGDELAMTTERVVVFKDGYSLFVKRGSARTNADGQVFSEQVPDAAVLGSFWAVPSKGRLISMTAGKRTRTDVVSQSVSCMQHIEILRENVGQTATIELDRDRVLEGRIGQVLTETTTTAAPATQPLLHRASSFAPEIHARELTSTSGNLFVLQTAAGDTLLPVSRITRLTIQGMKTECARETRTTQTTKRLTFYFEEPNVTREIVMMYFVPDLRWIPTYRAELGRETEATARLMLQAELLNEREDLIDVPVELVVGVPHFRFKETVSPFSLESTLRSTLQQVAPQLMSQSMALSNASFDVRSAERISAGGGDAPGVNAELELPAELTGAGTQDLFVYSLPKLTLLKGDRAAVPIFSATVPIRDIYTWDVHVKRSIANASAYSAENPPPIEIAKNNVWHQLVLTNRASVPWTTGPVLLFQRQRPLGQELLTYTPPGRNVRVPVTVSVDTRGTYQEKEISRALRALRIGGRDYARIHSEGTLRVVNSKKVAIDMEVTARFEGQVDVVSHGGIVSRASSSEITGHSDVAWKVALQPGESISLPVSYHYFIRH